MTDFGMGALIGYVAGFLTVIACWSAYNEFKHWNRRR